MRSLFPCSVAVLFTLLLTGCQKTVGQLINERIVDPMAVTRTIDVHFFTNRATTSLMPACSSRYFRNVPSSGLHTAVCQVSVPAKHAIGALDVSEDRNPDRDSYFLIGGYQAKAGDSIYETARAEKEVMLFVHGFNVPFEEAILRAAQIKYDVKYQKPIFLFTWPAGSGEGMLDGLLLNLTYAENQKYAVESIGHLAYVLKELNRRNVRVNLVVHSMGHQIAIPAMLKLVREEGMSQFLNEVIFNAPDYPSGQFAVEVSDLVRSARRITVYCSPGDKALLASQKVNQSYRLGLCLRIDGVDMINVNEVDAPALGIGGLGHGYYSGRAILVDLYQTLDGVEAEKRLFIRRSSTRMEHYVLRK
jgi:esterase/lipase superfamily enzyme